MSKYITRQELAVLSELSEDVIRKSEKQFGLLPFKSKPTPKCVRYLKTQAIAEFKIRGLIPS